MPSIFRLDALGPWAPADPQSEKRWGVVSWLDGLTIASATWAITPSTPGTPAILNDQINAAPVIIDGKSYAAGLVASAIVKGLAAGTTYTVTVSATFSDGQKDDKSFRLVCAEQ